MKRLLSLALCAILLLGVVFPAYAMENDTIELTQTSTPVPEACTECGQTEGHAENCSQYVAPASIGCAECGQTDGHAETCSQYVAPASTGCTECGQTEGHAMTCSLYVSPTTGCAECGQTEGHAESCSQYVAPASIGCTECGQTNGHAETCSQNVPPVTGCAECGQTDGHAVTCSQYVAPTDPAETSLCDQCNAVKNDDGVIIHEKTCPNYVKTCTCTPVEGVHQVGCDFYVVPVDSNAELYEKLMATATMEEFDALMNDVTEEEQNALVASLTVEQLQALREHIQSIASKQEPPRTVVFTDAGPFMPAVSVSQIRSFARAFALTRDTVTDNGLELSKNVIRANDDGSFTIRMEAYTTGEVTTSTKTVPVDVVLVLDQSGSMAYDFSGNSTNNNTARRQYAMKQAVNNFIGSVAEKYSDEADHRISIVTFGSGASTLQGWTFVDDSGETTLKGKISGLPDSPSGATNVGAGMTQAESLMGSGYSYSGSNTQRQKVVIVFTDGVPTTQSDFDTTVATSAIASAKNLKDGGATVYTVGIFNGANPDQLHGEKFDYLRADDVACSGEVGSIWGAGWVAGIFGGNDFSEIDIAAGNRFLNYLSSNFKSATEIGIMGGTYNPGNVILGSGNGYQITKNFDRTDSNYYLTANDSASLNEIFQTISDNIQTANIDLGSSTRIVDTVSDYFVIPEGTSDIKLYTAAAKADGTFDSDVAAPDSVSATRDSSGKTISVTGFDFNANFVSDKLKEDGTYGKKLVIEFNVVPRDGFLGGNDVPTNDWEETAVYDKDGTEVEKFADQTTTPTVNVPIQDVSVTAEDKNVYLLNDLSVSDLKDGSTAAVGEITLDLTDGDYGLESWQYDYVNISVAVTDNQGNTIANPFSLTDDTTYSVAVTVSPKTNGQGASGTPAVEKSGSDGANINVFKPEIGWKDTVIQANQTPVYADNFDYMKWFHLTGDQRIYADDESVTMIGAAPTLDFTYSPTASPITTDSLVDVVVKIGARDITSHVDFHHKCDCDLHTVCQWDDAVHGGEKGVEFIVHVSTFDLIITKTGTQPIDHDNANEVQSYIFHVTGPNGFAMDIVICGDGSKTIKNLPVGEYTITEEESWSWRYDAKASSYSVDADDIVQGQATVTVENTRTNPYWLNGGAYAHNVFGN